MDDRRWTIETDLLRSSSIHDMIMASKSRKTQIIEDIFNSRWDAATQTLDNPLVTIDEMI